MLFQRQWSSRALSHSLRTDRHTVSLYSHPQILALLSEAKQTKSQSYLNCHLVLIRRALDLANWCRQSHRCAITSAHEQLSVSPLSVCLSVAFERMLRGGCWFARLRVVISNRVEPLSVRKYRLLLCDVVSGINPVSES